MNWPALGIAVVILLPFLVPPARRWLRERARQRAMRADIGAFERELAKTNPPGPPLTPEEKADFETFVAGLALPAVELAPADGPVHAGGTRLGGPVWLAEGEAWPVAGDGTPLVFLAQLDFSDLPPLPDFPERGVLRFFIGNDDMFGVDFDDLAAGNFALLWREDLNGPGEMVAPAPLDDARACSPWMDEGARVNGRPLRGTAVTQQAMWGDWRIDARLDGWLNRPGFRELDDDLIERPGRPEQSHHVGGHPVYTQNDIRRDPRYQGHDICLLRLTSDDAIMWGDVGEAVFLIPREALIARDWSRVIYSWDCC
jgi:uncharacterized protein YwqG